MSTQYICPGGATAPCRGFLHRPSGCGEWNDSKDYYCTREKGHSGEHVACGSLEHNLYTWPNKNPPKEPEPPREPSLNRIEVAEVQVVGIQHCTPPRPLVVEYMDGTVGVTLEFPGHTSTTVRIALAEQQTSNLIRALVAAVTRPLLQAQVPVCGCPHGLIVDPGLINLRLNLNHSDAPIYACRRCKRFYSHMQAWYWLIPRGPVANESLV